MARNFRRPRASHAIADLNVTNLIDLGFILLVIFMIATPLIQQEQTVGVNLPSVAKAPQPKMKSDERHVAVAIDARGFYVDNQPTPLIQQEQTVGVSLPSVAKAPQPKMKSDERHVAVAIDARGFYVDNQPTPLTLAQLRTRFTALAAEPKPPVIRVRGDAAVPFQKVAEVMTELQRAGLSRITIDSKTDS